MVLTTLSFGLINMSSLVGRTTKADFIVSYYCDRTKKDGQRKVHARNASHAAEIVNDLSGNTLEIITVEQIK